MSARPRRSLWPAATALASFHDAVPKVAEGDAEAIADMDALDQIGETVIEAINAYFGEDTIAASSSG